MRKQPKKPRVPRTRAGETMTEGQFWTFIRANLRLMSCKWAPRRHILAMSRRPNQSENKRLKWEFQCRKCLQWFPAKEIEVDHIVPVGTLRSFDDIGGYVQRLLCEVDGLVVLCKQCHHSKTQGLHEE